MLGLRAVDSGEGDVITAVLPVSLAAVSRSQYRNVISRYVFPRIEGLDVQRVPSNRPGFGIGVIVIPPQPERLKPFLVHGVIVGNRIKGDFIGIPTREVDETSWTGPAMLHVQIRLGEAALRERER